MHQKLNKTISYGEGGWRAEVYTDDDDASGYGDNSMLGFWYGTQAECEAIDPVLVKLFPLNSFPERPDPFDLACERRWD